MPTLHTSSQEPQEIEAKFAVADEQTFIELLALRSLGPFMLRPHSAPQQQLNIYFDTADGRLRARRYGLRIRTVDASHTLTLKGPSLVEGDLHTRAEWEHALDHAAPDTLPPGELRERIETLSGGAALLPMLAIRTRRHLIDVVLAGEDAPTTLLALDEGLITARERTLPLRELELELQPGGRRADLEALAALVRSHFELEREPRSKLERAFELRDVPAPYPDRFQAIALALFDAVAPVMDAADNTRKLCARAAAAYAAARAAARNAPARVARDAILADLTGCWNPKDQATAAATAALLREPPLARREPLLLRLGSRRRGLAKRLAALLSLADAIAIAPVNRMAIAATPGSTRLTLAGPGCDEAVALVRQGSRRWQRVFGPISIVAGLVDDNQAVALVTPPVPLPALPSIVLTADEPAAEGARRLMRRQFERLLAREHAVRKGEDPEDVHQMRVAARRLRATLQVVERVFDTETLGRFRRGLRAAANALGEVRDLDVFLDALRVYGSSRSATQRLQLEPLTTAASQARARARDRMLDELDQQRYRSFRRTFARFLTEAGAGVHQFREESPVLLVRDVAGSTIWQRYEELCAYGPLWASGAAGDGQLHAARIACKRLRYTIEFFADPLGPQANELLELLTTLQDHFGAIQDGAAARARIEALDLTSDAGAQAYLAHLTAQRARLLGTLPAVWRSVDASGFRRQLLGMISQLFGDKHDE